jgi:pyruvate dehydrogenase E2 component (dihydrolipoamide acetyltransferase)
VIATPYAKQLAKDLRVDLSSVAGSGPNGRITASDVERAAKGGAPAAAPAAAHAAPAAAPAAAAPAAKPAAAAAPAAATTVSELRGVTKPFTTLQAAVSRNMIESLKVRRQEQGGIGLQWKRGAQIKLMKITCAAAARHS